MTRFLPSAAPCAATLSLTRGEVDLWLVRLDLDREPSDRELHVLSVDEAEHATTMSEGPRRRFVAARTRLRKLLAAYLSAEPASIELSYGAQGKPRLAGAYEASGLCFNLSHSSGHALFGFARSPLGVDLETMRPLANIDRLARRVLSDLECRELGRLPAAARERAFLACWTRKEAYAKAVGQGIVRMFRNFSVTLAPGSKPALLLEDGSRNPCWTLLDLEPWKGMIGALAVRQPVCRPTLRLLEPPGTE